MSNETEKKLDVLPIQEWKTLYSIVDTINELKPWEKFSEVDLAEIYLPNDNEPYYCSISGMFSNKGVSIYKGQTGLVSFSNYINSVDLPEYIIESRRNCVACIWGGRGRLKKRDSDILKEIPHSYRGNDAWPLFRKYETGYAEWYLDKDEIEMMTSVLRELVNALQEMNESAQLSNVKEGQRIKRKYNQNTGSWTNKLAESIGEIEAITGSCVITDELLIRRMKKQPVNGEILEFDMPYLPIPLRAKAPHERPFYPRLCIMCDSAQNEVVNQYFVDRHDDPNDLALGMVISYVENYGRPESIYVREPEMMGMIGHLCHKTGIGIYFTPSLQTLDYYVQDMILTMLDK